jgi:hypothetical protein
MKQRFWHWLDGALWGPETAARLLFVHTGLALLIGARVALGPYPELAGTPEALFVPVPVLAFLPGMPPLWLIVALQVIGAAAALVAALRRYPRAAFGLAWGCYLALAGLFGSRGKVMHNDLLLLWTAVPFLLAPVGVPGDDPQPRREYGWPVRSAAFIAAAIYGLAGYHKVLRSGPAWAYGDNLRYVLLWGPIYGRGRWEEAARWVADRWWAYKGASVFSLLFELTFPLVLVWRRLQPWYAVTAVGLHLLTWVFLGLDYWAWSATALLVFVDWPAAISRLQKNGGFLPGKTYDLEHLSREG